MLNNGSQYKVHFMRDCNIQVICDEIKLFLLKKSLSVYHYNAIWQHVNKNPWMNAILCMQSNNLLYTQKYSFSFLKSIFYFLPSKTELTKESSHAHPWSRRSWQWFTLVQRPTYLCILMQCLIPIIMQISCFIYCKRSIQCSLRIRKLDHATLWSFFQ